VSFKCEHCGERFTAIKDKHGRETLHPAQIIATGPDDPATGAPSWYRAVCWNCNKPTNFFLKSSKLNKIVQEQREKEIERVTQDLVNQTRKDGVVWDGDDN
jgi:hypothetical protein